MAQVRGQTAMGRRILPEGRLRWVTALSLALFAVFALSVTINAWMRPIANWDMLPYAALALPEARGGDAAVVHARAYALVREHVTEAQWADLTAVGRYRVVQAHQPEAFVSMFPMYEVKGGFIGLVRAATALTDPVTAMRSFSLAAAIALFAAVAWTFWRLGALHLLALTLPVMSALGVVDQASLSGPDLISSALTVWAVALMLVSGQTRPPVAALCLLVAAVALRPDMLVATSGLPFALIAGALGARLIAGERLRPAAAQAVAEVGPWPWLSAVAGVGVYLAVKAGVDHPGWWAHFTFSFLEQKDSMAGPHPAFEWTAYLSALARVSLRLMRTETWPWIVAALALGALLWLRAPALPGIIWGLLVFVAGVMAARYLVFPLPDARVALPWVLGLTMILCAAATAERRHSLGARIAGARPSPSCSPASHGA